MNWYKLSNQELNNKLKDIIRHNSFMLKMLKNNSIPIDRIDKHLTFKIEDLDGKKAQSDSQTIIFDCKVFENNFVENGLHFLIHELYHWIIRQKEKNFYFADPEEIEAFSLGIAYELSKGLPLEAIAKIYYPIIQDHFDDKMDAKKLFQALVENAQEKLKFLE
jgi:hypothetical protein